MKITRPAASHSTILGVVVLGMALVGSRPVHAQPPAVPVRITNPSVPITPPAHTGFNASCYTGNVDAQSGQAGCALVSIPAGRQIVIETISCRAELNAGQGPAQAELTIPSQPLAGGAPVVITHTLALIKQFGNSTSDIWVLTTPLRAYGSGGQGGSTSVGLFFRANPGPLQGLACTISGHLVAQ